MKRPTIWIVSLCFALPLGLLFYKTQILHLSLLPHKVDDVWALHVTVKPKEPTARSVSFPIPRSGDGHRVTEERIRQKGFNTLIDRSSDSAVLTWLSKYPITEPVSYSARVDIKAVQIKKISADHTVDYPKAVKKFLKLPVLVPEEEAIIKALEAAIYERGEDKTSRARKAFYYVDEEIQRNLKQKSFTVALETGKGSPLVKARLFSLLCRRAQIPARVVAILRLPEVGEPPAEKFRLTFANEVFLNGRWIPVDTNRGHFGERPARYMMLHHNYDEIEKSVSKQTISYHIRAERAVMNKFNKAEYRKEVMNKGSFTTFFSLYRLSLPMQAVFATILLVPLGALVLSVARNMLGVPTFGMFTPILLTLFFKETSLTFGIGFFMAVVVLGLLERKWLDKLYLLAVPRLSILLTLVIVLLMVVAFTGLAETLGASHIGYFPIVIVTSFIERFSIMLTEEGTLNTLKTLTGTLVISLLAYLLYALPSLEILLFTNPELLLIVIGLLVLVGKYKGYRVSEFIRFRDLLKQVKALRKTGST